MKAAICASFDKLGAHEMEFEGIHGTHFAVWAPNAQRVSVVGPWNEWDGGATHAEPGRHLGSVHSRARDWYDLQIRDRRPQRAGAAAQSRSVRAASEMRPRTASVVPDPTPFTWTDQRYMEERASKDWRRTPMSIYEVHLGSWRRPRRRQLHEL